MIRALRATTIWPAWMPIVLGILFGAVTALPLVLLMPLHEPSISERLAHIEQQLDSIDRHLARIADKP